MGEPIVDGGLLFDVGELTIDVGGLTIDVGVPIVGGGPLFDVVDMTIDVQGGQTKFPHWFEPLLLWPQRLRKFNTICITYLHP